MNKMAKINEAVGEKNFLDKCERRKRSVCQFKKNEFCKFIGCIISVVTYRIRGHQH